MARFRSDALNRATLCRSPDHGLTGIVLSKGLPSKGLPSLGFLALLDLGQAVPQAIELRTNLRNHNAL